MRWFSHLYHVARWRLRSHSRVSLLTTLKFPKFISIGKNCIIRSGAMIDAPRPGVVRIGDNVDINRHVYLGGFGDHLEIGSGSTLNRNAFIDARGSVRIGSKVMIGPYAKLISYSHIFADPDKPMIEQGISIKEIVVDDDVWIGAGAIVLPGVHLGRGSIVGAGAVVTRSCAPGSVLAGSPARVIRSRLQGA